MANQPKYDGTDGGPIELATAKAWAKNFRDTAKNPEEVRAHYFGRDLFLKILAQAECSGMRIYYGLKDDGTKELMLVGVDGKGDNMLPGAGGNARAGDDDNIIGDVSYPCPSVCPGQGDL